MSGRRPPQAVTLDVACNQCRWIAKGGVWSFGKCRIKGYFAWCIASGQVSIWQYEDGPGLYSTLDFGFTEVGAMSRDSALDRVQD